MTKLRNRKGENNGKPANYRFTAIIARNTEDSHEGRSAPAVRRCRRSPVRGRGHLERVAALVVDTGLDGALAPVRDGDGVMTLPAPVVVGLPEHPLPRFLIADPGGRVEQKSSFRIEDADLGREVIEESAVLLELFDQVTIAQRLAHGGTIMTQ